MSKIELNRYGWDFYGVVSFVKEWCILCTKVRHHEVMDGQKVCMACANVVEPTLEETIEYPPFQIERFIKGEDYGA